MFIQRFEFENLINPPRDALVGNLILHPKGVRKLKIAPKANFPQHMFIDSIE